MILECRVPLPSTPDAFDIFTMARSIGNISEPLETTAEPTTYAELTTTQPTQFMKLTGSITTAYSFSDDLNDPESEMFKEYASTLESEMSSIMMRSSMMKSVDLQVTGFQEVSAGRKRRQASDTKAMAEFEAFAQVSEDAVMEDVQGAVETEIQSATDEGLESLDADSFNTIGVVVATTITSTTSTTTATTTTLTTTTVATTTTTAETMTTTKAPTTTTTIATTTTVATTTTTTETTTATKAPITTTTTATKTTATTTTTSILTTTNATKTTTTTNSTTTTTLETTKTLATKTTATSTTAATTISTPELAPISTCPGGNEWFKIDQSQSLPWSWQASITIGRRASAGLFSCSGVIISADWILTAADCCIGSIVDEIEVYTGSRDFSHGTMHKIRYYKTQNEICAIRLDDKIHIDGKTTSVGCFKDESLDSDCWMAAWQHKLMTYNRQNRLISKSVEISNMGSTGSSACDSNSNMIDFTGSPVMCETGFVSYISGVVWEDRGTLDNNTYARKMSAISISNYELRLSIKHSRSSSI